MLTEATVLLTDVVREAAHPLTDAAWAIKSGDGVTTLLRFRLAVVPEMVDAVAP